MSLLARIFGRRQDDPYNRGVALYEEGRLDEAIEALREAASRRGSSPSGSLADFHLRNALVARGRRAVRADNAAAALACFEEAAAEHDNFPDLLFLVGAARALLADWNGALTAASEALRHNPDYCEARLLQACALVELDRRVEAADSLNGLVESGRRVENSLLAELARDGAWEAASVPADLLALVRERAGGDTLESEVASAVQLGRSGHWEEAADRLRSLVDSHAAYPDLRLKLAGVLFQTGRTDDALAEVDAALLLNPAYRSASCLRALILAEKRSYVEALAILEVARKDEAVAGRAHEELFAAYLGATLALLTGDVEAVGGWLGAWGDLTRDFPWGELVQAAADDLGGRPDTVEARLSRLLDAWPGDTEYRYLLVCHLLAQDRLVDADRQLSDWPAAAKATVDDRPLRLAAELALRRGDRPRVPAGAEERSVAWRLLDLRSLALRRKWEPCLEEARRLWSEGFEVESVGRVALRAEARLASPSSPGESHSFRIIPAAAVGDRLAALRRAGRPDEAEGLLARHAATEPEHLPWTWLNPAFWLDPIRRWIA